MKIKILISIILIIFIVTIGFNIFYSKIILKEDLIQIFGKSFFIVTSGSMEPEIRSGELIVITEDKNYKKNDIVTYKDLDNSFVTHRIVGETEKGFILKGDANNINDEEVLKSSIKGKVIYHSKLIGFFIIFILKPLVVIYIVLFIVINIYFYFISKDVKEWKIIKKS